MITVIACANFVKISKFIFVSKKFSISGDGQKVADTRKAKSDFLEEKNVEKVSQKSCNALKYFFRTLRQNLEIEKLLQQHSTHFTVNHTHIWCPTGKEAFASQKDIWTKYREELV